MFECFHCGALAVIWDCDFSFDDVGIEGDGIVQFCHCTNCGAEIEYRISFDAEEEEQLLKEKLKDNIHDNVAYLTVYKFWEFYVEEGELN